MILVYNENMQVTNSLMTDQIGESRTVLHNYCMLTLLIKCFDLIMPTINVLVHCQSVKHTNLTFLVPSMEIGKLCQEKGSRWADCRQD